MAYATYEQAIAKKATSNDLVKYVVEQVSLLGDGQNATIDFLDRAAVGEFCRALGFAADRHWACLLYTSDAAAQRSSVDPGGRRSL